MSLNIISFSYSVTTNNPLTNKEVNRVLEKVNDLLKDKKYKAVTNKGRKATLIDGKIYATVLGDDEFANTVGNDVEKIINDFKIKPDKRIVNITFLPLNSNNETKSKGNFIIKDENQIVAVDRVLKEQDEKWTKEKNLKLMIRVDTGVSLSKRNYQKFYTKEPVNIDMNGSG